jgi:hypothetical protein
VARTWRAGCLTRCSWASRTRWTSAGNESFNFEDNGLTHVDFSAGVPLTAGTFSITPVLHLQVNGDEATTFHSPSSDGSDVKVWGGVSIGWSNAAEEVEAEE